MPLAVCFSGRAEAIAGAHCHEQPGPVTPPRDGRLRRGPTDQWAADSLAPSRQNGCTANAVMPAVEP